MANPLWHLSGPSYDKAVELLSYIVDRPEDFENSVRFMLHSNQVQYFIEGKSHPRGPHPDIFSTKTVLDTMVASPVMAHRTHTSFSFSIGTIEAYKRIKNPSDEQIQSAIGRMLFNHYRQTGEGYIHVPKQQLAKAANVEQSSVRFHIDMLFNLGLLEDIGPINSADPDIHVQFTQAGYRWAARGCREDELASGTITNVQVNVHVLNVLPLIKEIEQSDADEQSKLQLEEVVRELQKEPTIEKAERLFSMAASVQQLFPTVARFIADNSHFFSQIPH